MVPNGVHNIEVPLYTTTLYNIHCTCTYTIINYTCSPFYKGIEPNSRGSDFERDKCTCTCTCMYVGYRICFIFARHWKFGMTKINHNYENCLHSCGLYTMGLVKTKFLLIEHLEIEIFADEN